MTRNDEFLEKLCRANPIESVIGSYIPIQKKGRNYSCSCPFHSEKTPSFTVFTDTQSFYCFGCGAGGDVITFIKKIENLEFPEAIKLLAQRSGIEMPSYSGNSQNAQRKTRIYEMNRLSANFFYKNLISSNDKAGLQYLIERNISPQTIKKYGLGYAPDSWDTLVNFLHSKGYHDDEISDAWLGGRSKKTGNMFDMFRKRVIFPIIDLQKNVIGFGGRVLDDSKPKYLNTAKTPVFDKGSHLFSLNFAKNSGSKKIILCEGYMDVIALNQAGFENAVATLGTAITPEQARAISRHAEEVVIAYDSDGAGQKASQKAINQFSDVGLRTTVLHMNGAKDPDEFIKNFGRERFRMLLDKTYDANNFMLDKCEQGLDPTKEADKVELLKRLVSVLAGIKSPIERDVYISRTSHKYDISVDVLKNHIDDMINNSIKKEKKKEWRSIKSNVIPVNDNINPDSIKNIQKTRAEENIIYFLMSNPEDYQEIMNKIPPENFVTSFNRKVYETILDKIKNSEKFSLSMLSENFTPEEMGRISGIYANNRDKGIDWQVILDCANVLKDSFSLLEDGEISIDSVQKLFDQKVNK
ncbi:MAG: DNA primase [Ruminococcus sp.]|nr:DNA primase [Ruminococcus sp.]